MCPAVLVMAVHVEGEFVVKEVQVGLCRWGPGVVCVD